MLYIVYVIIWGNYSEVIRRHPEFHGINDPTWKSNLSDLDFVLSGRESKINLLRLNKLILVVPGGGKAGGRESKIKNRN